MRWIGEMKLEKGKKSGGGFGSERVSWGNDLLTRTPID